jgi:signal transduction histidine kinase
MKDELIVKSNKNIINVINEIRQLSRSLMDPSIGDLGLIDSIYDLVENINLTRKLHVKLHSDADMETLLDKNHKLTVFRIIQETLNNAMRHAKATSVSISFTRIQNQIEISIEDNGIGFDLAMIKKGAGLKNIQNRIYLINGTHTIQTAPGKGCRITIGFPIIKQPLEITN